MQSLILEVLTYRVFLFTLTSCLAGNSNNTKIIRGERDRFTNIAICNEMNAVCYNKNCTLCECMVNQTFVQKRGQYGECVLNKMMVYASSVGCETFADGSSLIILNKRRCEEHSECLGEKEISSNNTGCILLPSKTQYLHNDTWRALEIKSKSFWISSSEKEVLLKVICNPWDMSKTPKNWNGLLVKVQFQCEGSITTEDITESCIIIKYSGAFTGFNYTSKEDDSNDENATEISIIDQKTTDSDKQNTSDTTEITMTIIFIVGGLVLLFIGGLIGIMIHKCKDRFVCFKIRDMENADFTQPEVPSDGSQLKPREPKVYEMEDLNQGYEYVIPSDRTLGEQPQNPREDLPHRSDAERQSSKYEYVSVRKPRLGKDRSEHPETTHSERDDAADKTDVDVMVGGEYDDALDRKYTPLVRQSFNDNEDEGYAHLNNGDRRNEVAHAPEKGDRLDVDVIDDMYTSLAGRDNDVHFYEPLVKE